MVYLLELPDRLVPCTSAEQARRLAELFIVLMTGKPPAA
jgi:hypothetical protein